MPLSFLPCYYVFLKLHVLRMIYLVIFNLLYLYSAKSQQSCLKALDTQSTQTLQSKTQSNKYSQNKSKLPLTSVQFILIHV